MKLTYIIKLQYIQDLNEKAYIHDKRET